MKNKTPRKPFKLIVGSLLCLLMLLTIVPRVKTIVELSDQKQELQKKKISLTKINVEHKKELKELKSSEAIERIAREQLGMIKKGERPVVEVMEP